MASAVQELVDTLNLETLELNLFRGRSPQSRWQRVFGGQVIGQALVAACRTVGDVAVRPPHSLHGYFLIGGDPKVPIIYEVDRIRDGRSFTTRRTPPFLTAKLPKLSPLTSFVLPGGTPGAAYLHMARTICRRAERMMVELASRPDEPVSDPAIQYINRLSDFLFVASRAANNNGTGDVLWVPGQNR